MTAASTATRPTNMDPLSQIAQGFGLTGSQSPMIRRYAQRQHCRRAVRTARDRRSATMTKVGSVTMARVCHRLSASSAHLDGHTHRVRGIRSCGVAGERIFMNDALIVVWALCVIAVGLLGFWVLTKVG